MIKRLKVKNFKIHKETEIFFQSPLSILTGENNSGKTSLLEALMIFSECYTTSLRKIQRTNSKHVREGRLAVGQFDFLDSVFISYFASVRSENYYELFFQDANSFEIEAEFEGVEGGEEPVPFTVVFEVKQGRNQTAYNIENKTRVDELVKLNQSKPEQLIEVIKSSPIASLMRNEPYMPPRMLQKQLAENAQVSTLRNRLLEISRQHKLQDLQGQLQFIMGFDDVDLRVTFDPNEDLYIQADFRINTQDRYQDIAMLGSGTLQMLEVLVSLNLSSRATHRVILLDEPDSFLHRRLQQNLISKLREVAVNGGVQVIGTTHNEQVISSAQLDEVYHLGLPQLGQTVKALSADLPRGRIKGMLAPQEKTQLYDALGVSASAMNILEAIEADRLVLVEGRTDALYVQALQAKRQSLVPSPNPRQVAFWSINGISDVSHKLKYWRDIFSSIKNSQTLWEKALLLLDSDYLDRQEMMEVASKIQEKFGITCYWLPSYTLESSLLLDLPAFEKSVSRAFSVSEDQVHERLQYWQQGVTIEDRKQKIEAQRRDRIKDFKALDSSFLDKLCDGNHYASYLGELESDPQQLSRLATKEDVVGFVRSCAELASDAHFEAFSDEALLLHVIDAAERRFWFGEWTPILQAIYG
jgi:AAA15 family ATPase/GTPase